MATGLKRRDILATRCCEPDAVPANPGLVADARVFRALGDETRLQIVHLLARQTETLCACYLEAAFTLSQPTISHHLKVLRDAGLVTTERRGVWIYYQLQGEQLRGLSNFVETILPEREPTGEKTP